MTTQTITSTQASDTPVAKLRGDDAPLLPDRLDPKFSRYPKLTREQCGHLRHIHNLASLVDGEWSLMGSQEPGQEWDTAFRYQIATMAYAAGAAHYHRLPAMRSMFKSLMWKLIQKMLRREVWGYWYNTSVSGPRLDPDIKELRKPWADPVFKENIMYSGHLLTMVSLYTMLFADDTFDKQDSIVFDWNPMFWGWGPERFTYTRLKLQDVIVKEMERNNWIGVCCEPNLVFVICNQFPLLSMRYNDVTDGTHVLDEVLPKYKAAWAKKNGIVGDNGFFRRYYRPKQDDMFDTEDISHTVWAMSYMPWNYDVVQSMYPSVTKGYLSKIGDRLNLNSQTVGNKIRSLAKEEGADPDSPVTLARARELTAGKPQRTSPYARCTFGYLAQYLSEIEGGEDLDALLRHADAYLNPSWRDGGLYYPRREDSCDEEYNYTYVDPYTGNAAIAYARLNVKNGQKKIWDHPWTKEEVQSRPWVDGVDLVQDVDCLRGSWDVEEKAMLVSLKTWNGHFKSVRLEIKSLPAGQYGVYINGELQKAEEVSATSGSIAVDLMVDSSGVDLVVLHA